MEHQFPRKRRVFDRELEFVGLDRSRLLGADAGLDEFAFVRLEKDSLVDDIVQLTALDPFAEDEEEAEIEEYGQCDDGQYRQKSQMFFHSSDRSPAARQAIPPQR